MRKITLLFSVLAVMSFCSINAQTVFYSEDFESTTTGELTSGWTMELGDASLVWSVEEAKTVHDEDNGDWESTAHAGSKSLFNVENWGADGPTDVIGITPVIDLSNASSAILTFFELRSWDNYWPDSKPDHVCFILAKEVGADTWSEVQELSYSQDNFQNWMETSVNLDAFVGKNIVIGFKSSTHHYFWRIDDVKVEGLTVGIENDVQQTLNIYPNPTNSKVFVNLENSNSNSEITVYNSIGKVINVDFQRNENQVAFDFSNLSNGVYFISVNGINQKIIKN